MIDVITVSEKLKNQRVLTDIGGPSYLTNLSQLLPTAASVDHYARLVKEKIHCSASIDQRQATRGSSPPAMKSARMSPRNSSIKPNKRSSPDCPVQRSENAASESAWTSSDLVNDVIQKPSRSSISASPTSPALRPAGFTRHGHDDGGLSAGELDNPGRRASFDGKNQLCFKHRRTCRDRRQKARGDFLAGNVPGRTDAPLAVLPGAPRGFA